MNKWMAMLTSRAERLVPFEMRRIQGFHRVHYRIQLESDPLLLDLNFLVILAGGTGSCFVEDAESLTSEELRSLIGRDSLFLDDWPLEVRVAGLDAAWGAIQGDNAEILTLCGHPRDKARDRAKVVATEAKRLVTASDNGKVCAFACVGAVGHIIEELHALAAGPIRITDFNRNVIGTSIMGSVVCSGEETLDAVAAAKVAVVTGMTLGNGTFGEICETARAHNTRLLLFSETGANLGHELLNIGATTVISEPFPFYNIAVGKTEVRIHRK